MTASAKTLRAQRAWNKAHPFTVKVTRYKIVVPTLAALERAAMQWYEDWLFPPIAGNTEKLTEFDRRLYLTCAAHAAALKRKRTGRR